MFFKNFLFTIIKIYMQFKTWKKGIDNWESSLVGFELNGIILERFVFQVFWGQEELRILQQEGYLFSAGMWIQVWIFLLVACATLGKALNLSVPHFFFSVWLIEEVVCISLRYLSAKIFSESENFKRKSININ